MMIFGPPAVLLVPTPLEPFYPIQRHDLYAASALREYYLIMSLLFTGLFGSSDDARRSDTLGTNGQE